MGGSQPVFEALLFLSMIAMAAFGAALMICDDWCWIRWSLKSRCVVPGNVANEEGDERRYQPLIRYTVPGLGELETITTSVEKPLTPGDVFDVCRMPDTPEITRLSGPGEPGKRLPGMIAFAFGLCVASGFASRFRWNPEVMRYLVRFILLL